MVRVPLVGDLGEDTYRAGFEQVASLAGQALVRSGDPGATEDAFNARLARCVLQVGDRPGLPTDSL